MHYVSDLFTDTWWISYIWHANRVTLDHQWLSRECHWRTQRVGCKFIRTMYWTLCPAHTPRLHKISDLHSKMANFVCTIIGHPVKYFPNLSALVSDLAPNCQGSWFHVTCMKNQSCCGSSSEGECCFWFKFDIVGIQYRRVTWWMVTLFVRICMVRAFYLL